MLTPSQTAALCDALPRARWFMAKHRVIRTIEALDSIPLYANERCRVDFVLLNVHFQSGPAELYGFPLGSGSGIALDAFSDPGCADFLVHSLFARRALCGRHGRLECVLHAPPPRAPWPAPWAGRYEQSNSAIVFPDRFFCKLYRRLEASPHPEAEMGLHLRAQGFSGVPRVLGTWRYRTAHKCYTLGILQELVVATGDAWTHLGGQPDKARAALLGQRTAQMHLALYTPSARLDFAPTSFTAVYRRTEHFRFCQLTKNVTQKIVDALPGLSKAQHKTAQKLLQEIPRLPALVRALREHADCGQRIRIHGDLHLGQILCTESDFYFLDFEGEPARALPERRIKHSPLRDVAGMLRSFAYAVASFPEAYATSPSMADAYLQAYLKTIGAEALLPQCPQALHALLKSYVLEKALYEIGYEIANRPDWLAIPAEGLLSTLESLDL